MQAFFDSFGLLYQNLSGNRCTKVQVIQWSCLLFDESKGLFTIPEWVSFRNEFRSRMKFTWQNRPAQLSWKHPFCPPFWKWYACATRPRLHGLRFHLGTELVFSLHDTRTKYHTRTRISFGLKTRMNSFRNDLCGDEISSRYHVNRYREIYGDGMNSFWNESHSGIM